MPGGRGGRVGTLGGIGLAVSRSSAHPREAVSLIRFLISRELQSKADSAHPKPAAEPQLYGLPQILQAYTPSAQLSQPSSRLVSRPSKVTGDAYEHVTQA